MGTHRANADLDAKAVARVLQLEAAEGRTAIALPDGTTVGVVSHPPRMIEVRAFAGAADELWLDGEQVDAAYADPNFWLYVVEHAAAQDVDDMVLTRLSGPALHALLDTRVEYRYAEIAWPSGPAETPTGEIPVVADYEEYDEVEYVEAGAVAYDEVEYVEAGQPTHDVEFEDADPQPAAAHQAAQDDEPQYAAVGAAYEESPETEEPAPSRWFR